LRLQNLLPIMPQQRYHAIVRRKIALRGVRQTGRRVCRHFTTAAELRGVGARSAAGAGQLDQAVAWKGLLKPWRKGETGRVSDVASRFATQQLARQHSSSCQTLVERLRDRTVASLS
jgi:hypothetical protein